MPELSRFYGIVVQVYYGDHPPPHVHATYGEYSVVLDVETLAVIQGRLPARALGMLIEWATLHQAELRDAFRKAANLERPDKIEPLP